MIYFCSKDGFLYYPFELILNDGIMVSKRDFRYVDMW